MITKKIEIIDELGYGEIVVLKLSATPNLLSLYMKNVKGIKIWQNLYKEDVKALIEFLQENMPEEENQRHILSILVDNEPGVLSRISGLFSGRGFNIESLCVAETNEPRVSRITLVTVGDMSIVEQIKKQLRKIINVMKVVDFMCCSYMMAQRMFMKSLPVR